MVIFIVLVVSLVCWTLMMRAITKELGDKLDAEEAEECREAALEELAARPDIEVMPHTHGSFKL